MSLEDETLILDQILNGNLELIDIMIVGEKPIPKNIAESDNKIIQEYLKKYECDVCFDFKEIKKTYCGCSIKYCADCLTKMDNFCKICNKICYIGNNSININNLIDYSGYPANINNTDITNITDEINQINRSTRNSRNRNHNCLLL
jgi:late competence protein required for DNA uptake (superfamily II DNA/RNA helicase)